METAEQSRYRREIDARQANRTNSAMLNNRDKAADRDKAVDSEIGGGTLLVLDDRVLPRDCLCQSMKSHDIGLEIAACGSLEDWNNKSPDFPELAAVLLIANGQFRSGEKEDELRDLVEKVGSVPVLVLADSDDLEEIVVALECGVQGYIPSSVGIAVCAEAIRLALVGGLFVPSSSVMAMRHHIRRKKQATRPMSSMFTQRQAEVVQALRKGKANKIIAYELNMRESTVKVHIRNIMKKLKATNRTEVAYKINDLFPEEGHKVVQ